MSYSGAISSMVAGAVDKSKLACLFEVQLLDAHVMLHAEQFTDPVRLLRRDTCQEQSYPCWIGDVSYS